MAAPRVAPRALSPVLLPRRPLRVVPLNPLNGAPPSDDSEGEVARQILELRISRHVPNGRLALAVTDNQYTMISVRRSRGLFRLRLHHMFLDAAPEVVRALGRYVAHNDRESSQLLGRFIDVNQRKIRRARARLRRPALAQRPVTVETRGDVHDLQAIFDALNAQYFNNAIDARITWGQRHPAGAAPRQRSSIKMGSYSVEDRLIRIHPSLDRPFVPRMFVEWIVFHEMLHQKHDIPVKAGRRQFHTPEFLAEEATFAHYHEVRLWERMHLDHLLEY
jgi:hypothetical protein